MPAIETFDVHVAARTRAADQILRTPDLSDLYEAHGGLRADLEEIRALGLQAEALSQTRSGAKAQGGGATLSVLEKFAVLQKEYVAVMAVVLAVRRDLAVAKAPPALLQAIDRILVNEAQVVLRQTPGVPDESGTAKPKRRAVRSLSQEAVRAEIHKDAAALLALKPAHAALARRKVTLPRLKSIRDDAQALASHLGERASKKGEGKAATKTLRDAVSAQKQAWSACYRILAAVGHADLRVRQLLSEAAGPRRAKKPPVKQ